MAQLSQIREAAGTYADEFTNGEDPNGTQAEQLVSDETFGTIAHCLHELNITHRYGDDLEGDIARHTDTAADELRDALEVRAEEVLE
ncbi:hypothetical protein [Natrinema amylolyticum]|uniref:hypothetical protein n=1 Tax=Natrinema amylolyticum TaxID=2878679 RepID=UPI001CF93E21|nr:hypothetical protein [Natrinema amylolyticum]